MDGTTLESVTEEKDLGVLKDDELIFDKHVSTAVSKANQTLGIVNKTFDTLDKELLPIFTNTRSDLTWNMEMLFGILGI